MIDAHRAEFEYDWRTRFSHSHGLAIVGTKRMTWGEAVRLTRLLAADPSSQVAAAAAGWGHPVDRTSIVLMDLFDLQHSSKVKRRPKAYPRPWKDRDQRRFGVGTRLIPDELRAILAAHRGVESIKQDAAGRWRDARGRFASPN